MQGTLLEAQAVTSALLPDCFEAMVTSSCKMNDSVDESLLCFALAGRDDCAAGTRARVKRACKLNVKTF
eukprot:760297-Hanusia_phi.AAC.3